MTMVMSPSRVKFLGLALGLLSLSAGAQQNESPISSLFPETLLDVGELEHIKFVMKGGAVVKNEFGTH